VRRTVYVCSLICCLQFQEEVEESAHAVEVLTQENEALRVQIEELLQQSRREGEVLHSSRNRLRPDKESLGATCVFSMFLSTLMMSNVPLR
jgi:hypothetical protein